MKYFNEPKEFTLFNIMRLFFINKIFIITIVTFFLIVIIAISYIIPEQYISTTSLMPPQKESGSSGLSSFIQNFTGGGLSLGNIGQSDQSKVFGEIVKSRTVADYIIDTLKLNKIKPFFGLKHDKILKYINENLNAEVNKSGLIFISANASTGLLPSGDDGKKAAILSSKIANAAVDGLDLVIRNKNMSSARKSKEYIEKEITRYMEKLDTVETKLQDFQQKNKVLAIDEQTLAIVKQSIEVGSQLAKADVEKNLALLEYQPGSPQYQFYQKQHELLSEQYSKIQKGGLTSNESFSFSLEKVPALLKEYASLYRERKIMEQVILYLETQHHQEAIQEKRDVPVIEVLDKAYPPEEKYSPKRMVMVLVAVILSLVFAFVYISVMAFKSGAIYLEENKKAKEITR